MKTFFKNNVNFFIYFLFSILIELSCVYVITDKFYIREPWILLTIFGLIFSVLNFIKSRKIKNITISSILAFQCILCLVFVVLYDNTGTYFDFNMLKLIGANNNFVVTITIDYLYIIFLLLMYSLFIMSILFLNKYQDKKYRPKTSLIISSICAVLFLISHIGIIISYNSINEKNFINNLYKDTNDRYVNLGSSTNAINEIYKLLFFNKYDKLSNDSITDYVYSEVSTPTSMFGVSKDNNLITILVESLEWFAFINDETIYPNGTNLNDDQLDLLFPNLRTFYNNSIVMNNHYSENKTDMSEDEALLGVYTSGDYMNFSFESNTMPTSIANVLKQKDNTITNKFAHNNDITFYNRNKFVPNLGYDELYFIDEMVENGATNYMKEASLKGLSMNLDSEMISSMKDLLFTEERFNVHLSTVSMHGDYSYKNNMQRWYDKIEKMNIEIDNEHLKNYIAYTMEFDYAIGLMIEDLKNKNLLEKTTIVIFSDHNTYMNHLSNYVKDIYDYSHQNYTELFRVPLMIYDPNIEHQIINKFTTTYDITPTILDMFGINHYSNLYYGNSIFSNKESILYSKAFDVFIKDDLFFSNINNILYKKENVNDTYIEEIEKECLTLLKKIYYTNNIFSLDYFKNQNNYHNYLSKMNNLNNFHN